MKRHLLCTATMFALTLITGCTNSEKNKSENSNTSANESKNQEVRFALSDSINNLDPRNAQGMASTAIVQLLFEGLTRIDPHGNVLPGVAENIHISPDMKTYTFSLRDEKWSNGDPLTASDFEYSWKSQLAHDTKATANYLLFTIKSAKAAFEGKCPLEQVGIRCPDEKTLVVELENPTPYFLQLTATPTYFPINHSWVEERPNPPHDHHYAHVSNGPFVFDVWKTHEAIELKKNDLYSSAKEVKLSKIHYSLVDSQKAFTMFENEQLDWIGTPYSHINQDTYTALKTNGKLKTAPAAGTFFLRANVESAPFNNQKMRRAFCLAIDSSAIVNEFMKEAAEAATSFVPPSLGLPSNYYTPHDLEGAKTLFGEALSEMHTTQDELAPITFCFIESAGMKKIAESLQKNWKEAFNVEVRLLELEPSAFYQRILSKDYLLASASWLADYFDPMSFLSIFQYKENGTNNTEWSSNDYTHLLEQSCLELNHERRFALLQQAQDILMNEMPIMPILNFSFVFAQSDKLQDAVLSPLGTMDLRKAYVVKDAGTTQKK